MPRYYVTEWDQRYEVDIKGRAHQDDRPKRAGPLEYVRLKVHGRSWGMGWRKLLASCNVRKVPGVFGIFCKILEIAADAPRDERGYVDDSPEEPLHVVLGLADEDIKEALGILVNIGWLTTDSEELNTTNSTQPTQPTNQPTTARARKGPECSGNIQTIPEPPWRTHTGFTLEYIQDCCFQCGIPDSKAEIYYQHYGAQGWKTGSGQEITDPRLHMQQNHVWDRNEQCWTWEAKKEIDAKMRLFPIPGRVCSISGCKLPAVYKATGTAYDHFYCEDHMPAKVKERYGVG